MIEVIVKEINLDKLEIFAKEILSLIKKIPATGAVVLALHGDLGAGKTTFTQVLGRCLGVTEDMTSPTFIIMKDYKTTDETFPCLVHMDAYRIDDENELGPLQFSEILATPHTLVVVEWAKRIRGALPSDMLNLTFTIKDENTRIVQID